MKNQKSQIDFNDDDAKMKKTFVPKSTFAKKKLQSKSFRKHFERKKLKKFSFRQKGFEILTVSK